MVFIHIRLVITIKLNLRHECHGTAIHIFRESSSIFQIHGIELRVITGDSSALHDLQNISRFLALHHLHTIVTQEHAVGYHVRTNLQVSCRSASFGIRNFQCRTITTHINGTMNNGRRNDGLRTHLFLFSCQTERYLLRIGAEFFKSLC